MPFFDCAYQGFATGSLEKDSSAVRSFADAGFDFLLAQSYAKNLGITYIIYYIFQYHL